MRSGNPKPVARKSETSYPHHKKLVDILNEEQAKRGMSESQFTDFLGFPISKAGNPNPTVHQWRKSKNRSPAFRLVIQMWRILGRSLDKDFL